MLVLIPQEIRSPIRYVIKYVPGSVELIAPENLQALTALVAGVKMEIVETREWVCCTNTECAIVKLSTGVVELLWCLSYAYWVFYKRVVAGQKPDAQEVDFSEHPEVAKAMDLLRWALSHREVEEPWPGGLPVPLPEPEVGSDEHVAQQLSLAALAFMLHHELAHNYLRHREQGDSSWQVDAERDADYFAADWILDPLTCPPEQRLFRLLGTAVALLALTAMAVSARDLGGMSHPRVFDRLFHVLSRHSSPEDDRLWGFVSAMLFLHMQSRNIWPEGKEYLSFYDFVNACIEKLAGFENGIIPPGENA